MKTGDAVREIMKTQEIGVNQMADRLNKSPRLVSERLSQENISITKLQELLRVLDYKIAILPRSTRLPEGGYELTVETDTKPKVDLDALLSTDDEPIPPMKKSGKRIKLK